LQSCKAWKGASKQQVPEKRLKWQNVAHNRGEFVKLGRNTHFRQTVGWVDSGMMWDALKTRFPSSCIHIKTADKTSEKKLEVQYLYAAVWRKSVKGNVLNNLGQLCP